MSQWNELVKKTFAAGRAKSSSYRLGDAMRDAKKVYKKTAKKLMGVPFGEKRKGRHTRHFKKSRKHRRGRGRRGGDPAVDNQSQDQRQDQRQDQSQDQRQDQNDKKGFFGLF